MSFGGIPVYAVGAAAAAGFLFGALWYTVLGKAWMAAASVTEVQAKPTAAVMVMTFACQLVMAGVLAGVIFHTQPAVGGMSTKTGLIAAALVWLGFIATALAVNHRFQGRPWALTFIDGGHWLGVLMVQAVVVTLLS